LPARLLLELRDQSLQLRIPFPGSRRDRGQQVAAVPEPGPIPLSTAEKRVFVREKRRLGAGNPIAISTLNPLRRYRPTAEIERGLRRLAAGRQWNSTALAIAEFGITEKSFLLTKSHKPVR
jgi:hypothetical protein